MKVKGTYGAVAVLLLCMADNAAAAGFALIEQSASGMGNAFAGAAAIAEDASTIFFNPAGMTYLPDSQLVIAAHAIKPSVDFSNKGSLSGAGTPMTGGNGGDAGSWAYVPNLYFSKSVSESVHLGIGINAPFGLKTEYDDNWVGRYHAVKSELKTININPSIAFKLNNSVSLGAGINYQRAQADLTNAIDFGTICAGTPLAAACAGSGITPQQADGKEVKIKGDDWSWGYNLGAILQLTPATRVGLAYRSRIKQELDGRIKFTNTPALFTLSPALTSLFANGKVKADLKLPSMISASIFHQANQSWDVMADLTWTEWSEFEELKVVRTSGTVVSAQPEKWDNTLRVSLGTNYHHSDTLKLRAGIAYDESPVHTAYRTPRIPDSDRYWLSLGANYRLSSAATLDFGYTHLFIKDSSLRQGAIGTSVGRSTGDFDSQVNILSIQYTHTF